MPLLDIAAINVNQTPLDWKGNLDRMVRPIFDLKDNLPDILLYPELSLTGYGCEDAFHSADLTKRALKNLEIFAEICGKNAPGVLVVIGLPVRKDGLVYDCCAVIFDGRVRGIVPKQNLAGDGVHYEPRWFKAWRSGQIDPISIQGDDVPFGPLLIEHRDARIIIEICEDAWVAQRPAMEFLSRGFDLILNPAASHFAFGKNEIRKNIALESSRIFCSAFVSVNLLGCEAGRMIYDGGAIFASAGSIVTEAERFSYQDYRITRSVLDLEANRVLQSRIYSFREQMSAPMPSNAILHLSEATVEKKSIGFFSREKKETAQAQRSLSVTQKTLSRDEEFLFAVTLGLFDYLRKSHSRGFVVSLSGGVDSAACALLVHRMLFYSILELGSAEALRKLGREDLAGENPVAKPGASPEEARNFANAVSSGILFTIYQATRNSSDVTRKAAAGVAKEIHSKHFEEDIQSLVDGYLRIGESFLGRPLDWKTEDLSLQNIQARVRSPLAWLLANLHSCLLITTSNRSEAAVGYCTMDGDTSGGLAPIVGVDKAFLRKWMLFMETHGDAAGKIPQLNAINEQAPTAELRPLSAGQTDEKDLMPYELLNQIEKLAVLERKSPLEIFRILRGPQIEDGTLKAFIKRYFTLWSRNQWKRERYAPGFHLDDENLDPRTWYRFPILSGAYAEELEELD